MPLICSQCGEELDERVQCRRCRPRWVEIEEGIPADTPERVRWLLQLEDGREVRTAIKPSGWNLYKEAWNNGVSAYFSVPIPERKEKEQA